MLLRRIAYVVKCFPMLTQTFIVGELSDLLRRGIDLRIVSMQTPVEPQRTKSSHNWVSTASRSTIRQIFTENSRSSIRSSCTLTSLPIPLLPRASLPSGSTFRSRSQRMDTIYTIDRPQTFWSSRSGCRRSHSLQGRGSTHRENF